MQQILALSFVAKIWCCDDGHTNRTETDILLWEQTQVSRAAPRQKHQQTNSHPITFLKGKSKIHDQPLFALRSSYALLQENYVLSSPTHRCCISSCLWTASLHQWDGNKAATNGWLASKIVMVVLLAQLLCQLHQHHGPLVAIAFLSCQCYDLFPSSPIPLPENYPDSHTPSLHLPQHWPGGW